MVLTHHLPEEYDHTLKFGRLYFCARCSGMLLGVVVGFFPWPGQQPALLPLVPLWVSLFLPLPAFAGYVAHLLWNRRISNVQRVLTGILLGVAIGFVVERIITQQFLEAVVQAICMAILLSSVFWLMHRKGLLAPKMKNLEQRIRK